jgi:DNA-binding IclR family transcriptional regulator
MIIHREKINYLIQSVSHAIDVLEEFKGNQEELGVTDLSKKLKLHKNNIFRILATLEARGYIEQNKSTENYRLGIKCLQLGQAYIKQMGLVRQAKPILERVSKETGETSYISFMRGSGVVYLDSVESSKTVRVISRVGLTLPPYCTASGKVHLAYLTEEERERVLPEDLRPFTKHTITERERLVQDLEQIKERGWAIDNEEYEDEVRCAAAPVFDYTGKLVGALSISGPSFRLGEEEVPLVIVPAVKSGAEEVSQKLGYTKSNS